MKNKQHLGFWHYFIWFLMFWARFFQAGAASSSTNDKAIVSFNQANLVEPDQQCSHISSCISDPSVLFRAAQNRANSALEEVENAIKMAECSLQGDETDFEKLGFLVQQLMRIGDYEKALKYQATYAAYSPYIWEFFTYKKLLLLNKSCFHEELTTLQILFDQSVNKELMNFLKWLYEEELCFSNQSSFRAFPLFSRIEFVKGTFEKYLLPLKFLGIYQWELLIFLWDYAEHLVGSILCLLPLGGVVYRRWPSRATRLALLLEKELKHTEVRYTLKVVQSISLRQRSRKYRFELDDRPLANKLIALLKSKELIKTELTSDLPGVIEFDDSADVNYLVYTSKGLLNGLVSTAIDDMCDDEFIARAEDLNPLIKHIEGAYWKRSGLEYRCHLPDSVSINVTQAPKGRRIKTKLKKLLALLDLEGAQFIFSQSQLFSAFSAESNPIVVLSSDNFGRDRPVKTFKDKNTTALVNLFKEHFCVKRHNDIIDLFDSNKLKAEYATKSQTYNTIIEQNQALLRKSLAAFQAKLTYLTTQNLSDKQVNKYKEKLAHGIAILEGKQKKQLPVQLPQKGNDEIDEVIRRLKENLRTALKENDAGSANQAINEAIAWKTAFFEVLARINALREGSLFNEEFTRGLANFYKYLPANVKNALTKLDTRVQANEMEHAEQGLAEQALPGDRANVVEYAEHKKGQAVEEGINSREGFDEFKDGKAELEIEGAESEEIGDEYASASSDDENNDVTGPILRAELLQGKIDDKVIYFYERVFPATDFNSFALLNIGRDQLVEDLLPKKNNPDYRKRLAGEINMYLIQRTREEQGIALPGEGDALFARYHEDDTTVTFGELENYCNSEGVYEYYLNQYRIDLQLGEETALLWAESQDRCLYIWERDGNEESLLKLRKAFIAASNYVEEIHLYFSESSFCSSDLVRADNPVMSQPLKEGPALPVKSTLEQQRYLRNTQCCALWLRKNSGRKNFNEAYPLQFTFANLFYLFGFCRYGGELRRAVLEAKYPGMKISAIVLLSAANQIVHAAMFEDLNRLGEQVPGIVAPIETQFSGKQEEREVNAQSLSYYAECLSQIKIKETALYQSLEPVLSASTQKTAPDIFTLLASLIKMTKETVDSFAKYPQPCAVLAMQIMMIGECWKQLLKNYLPASYNSKPEAFGQANKKAIEAFKVPGKIGNFYDKARRTRNYFAHDLDVEGEKQRIPFKSKLRYFKKFFASKDSVTELDAHIQRQLQNNATSPCFLSSSVPPCHPPACV